MSPLDIKVIPWYLKSLPGMNNKVEDLELKDKWVELAQNCRFEDKPGSVTKRPPLTYFNSTSEGAGAVQSLYRSYAGGVTKWVMIHTTAAYVGDDSAGDWTSIRTSLTTGKRASFVTYKNLLIVSNGYNNPWVYDGSSDNVTWELGSCKAVLASGGSNLDSAATYSYKIAIDSNAYICDAVSNTVTTDASNRKVTLSNIPLGPTGTADRKIYRTEGGGSTYYLIDTIAENTSTTYTDDIADTTATAMPAVTDDMPLGSLLQMHRERLFISGDPSNQSRIYYSNVGLPHYIAQTTDTDYMDVNPDDNDVITGIPIQLGVMCCIKKNTIRKLHITSSVSTAATSTWYADDPVSWNGCPAQWSVTQTPMGIIYLGWDHWYVFNGAFSKPIVDEFDTNDILPADYADVVSHFNNNVLLAAYTDRTIAAQYHDRVMRYNFKRKALMYDTIDANCFASKTGDAEKGELYYGDSQNGYVYQAENSDIFYQVQKKSELTAGTQTDTYVGGTEDAPHLEIGADSTASDIPENICIFWDDASTTPGSGWTEITSYSDKYIQIGTTYATEAGGSGHTHALTGTLATSNVDQTNAGDGSPGACGPNHSHTASGTSASGTAELRYVQWRVFSKDATAGTKVFPDGAIVMWDQAAGTPTGWESVVIGVGYYVRLNTASLNSPTIPSHNHTYDFTSDEYTTSNSDSDGPATECAKNPHDHDISGTSSGTSFPSWEVANVAFRFIKKVGEEGTWDGTDKRAYCLYADTASTPGNGFTVTTTYNGKFLKIGYAAAPTIGTASGAAHTHTVPGGTSGDPNDTWGSTGYNAKAIDIHTHSYTLTAASSDADTPANVTFRLVYKILGKMSTYNAAWVTSYTEGVWESPGAEIKALSLKKLFWNETLTTGDDVTIYTRTASTQALVEDGLSCTIGNDTPELLVTDAAHGLSNGDRVRFTATVVPTGLKNDIVYYVVDKDTNDFHVSLTSGGAAIAYTNTGTTVVYKEWETAASDPNGTSVVSTAANWFQVLVAFTAVDTKVTNPQIYLTDGYVVKMNYIRGASTAETAVEFIYKIGFRNFDTPLLDKLFKNIISIHDGSEGSFTIDWETENSSSSFTIDLNLHSSSWESFFPSDAMGRKISLRIYKNDAYDFELDEIQGLYSPMPVAM